MGSHAGLEDLLSGFPRLMELSRVAKRQAGNLARVAAGRNVVFPTLVSATLEMDDVELARELLAGSPASWRDEAPTRRYEAAFAEKMGVARAFAFASGRESFSACLRAMGVGPGDEVILPAYTCVVIPNAIKFLGAVPVFCDIELESYGLDIDRAREAITPRTKVIVAQHLFGMISRDFDALVNLARERGLGLIEDCAHAAGARWRGRAAGSFGDAAFFSSERSKILNTITGGVAATSDPEIAARLERIASEAPEPSDKALGDQLFNVVLDYYRYNAPGRWWRSDWLGLTRAGRIVVSTTPGEERGEMPEGYGMRMAGAIAAVGLNQLRKLDEFNTRRREAAAAWEPALRKLGLTPPEPVSGSTPVWLRYPILVDPERKRDSRWAERALGVRPGVWFLSKTHPAPCAMTGFPKADEAVARCVNFPTALDDRRLDQLRSRA